MRTKMAMIGIALAVASAVSSCSWLARHPIIGHSSKPKSKPAHDTLFAVTAEKTSFYHYGPQQGRGPDRELPRDTLVTVIRRSWGYSKVKLEDDEQGFVASDDLGRAPERLIAQINHDDISDLPPPPPVKLPTSDNSPEFEPTPIP